MKTEQNYKEMSSNNAKGLFFSIILFLICPFISFLNACRNPLLKFNKWIIIAFFGLLGFSRKLAEMGDANTWTNQMLLFNGIGFKAAVFSVYESFHNIAYVIFLYLFSQIKYTALIWCLIYMLTALFILYIYDVNCKELTVNKSTKHNVSNYVLFLFFMWFIPMSSYGVKFWVAMDVFLLGYYSFICKRSKVGIMFLIASALFHYTFTYLVVLFFAWYIIYRKPQYIFLIIAVLPFLFYLTSSFSQDAFWESKYEAYTSGSLIEQRALWFRLDKYFTAFFSLIFLIVALFRHKNIAKSETNKSLLSFLVFFAVGLIPLIQTLDGLDRFSRVFSFMVLILFVSLNIKGILRDRWLFFLAIPVYGYHLLVLYFMRKGEWELNIFYNSIFQFFSGGLMTQTV